MRLISWNVNRRTKQLTQQIDALLKHGCDLVALQEVTPHTVSKFREEFPNRGLKYIADSFETLANRQSLRGPRSYGVLIASRWPIKIATINSTKIGWPERLLSVVIKSPIGNLHLNTAYIPPGSTNGWAKIEVLEGIYGHLARKSKMRRILCGDFNTPKEELHDGTIITWRNKDQRWDAGERNILAGLAKFGLSDAFRHQHGYQKQEFSWFAHNKRGRRFDHVFATPSLLINANCYYLHSVREQRLSDHSALVFEFEGFVNGMGKGS